MRSHPACCPAQEYPAPRNGGKQQSERDERETRLPGPTWDAYKAASISLKRASKECAGSTAPGGCWNVLELTPGPWLPCLIKALHPSPPSKCLATVLLPPLHAGRLHRTSVCPRLRSRPFAVTDISCLQKKVYRLPGPGEKGFRAGGCWPEGLR